MVFFKHFKVRMPLIDAYIAWFFIGDNQKEYYHCKSGDEVNEGKF